MQLKTLQETRKNSHYITWFAYYNAKIILLLFSFIKEYPLSLPLVKHKTKFKTMKKVLFAAAMLASSMSFAQSNTKGTIHLGLGWGLQAGGATIKTTYPSPYEDWSGSYKGVGARANYGLRVGYGLADAFSLGLFLRSEGAAYTSTDLGSGTFIVKGLGVGLEPKAYVVNKDKFNLYFALPIGFSTGKAYSSESTSETTKMSGLTYGLNAGFNWYWADFIGMSLDLGYSGVSLSGKEKVDGLDGDIKSNISGGGVYFGLGLVSKFGGK